MAKLTLNDITAGYGSNDLLNANFTAIEEAIENTVSRDGTIPNSMSADLDMNGNAILNVKATNGNENFIWRGDWASSTAYTANNLVYVTLVESPANGGSTYICTTAHTSSGSFDSDIANWSLLAAQGEDGAPGAGTGDVVGPAGATANNIAAYDGTTGKLIKDSGYGVVDEDDMASDSDTKVPTQQSVKAYADTKAPLASPTFTGAATFSGTVSLPANSIGADEITDNTVGAAELNVTGNGTTSQYLRSDGDGSFTWATPPDTDTHASTAFGGIGSYTWTLTTGISVAIGATAAASSLTNCSSGTWRNMHNASITSGNAGLMVRIS